MKEKRVLQRTKLSFHLKVNEVHSSLYIGDIVDLNICSFLTLGPVEAHIGKEYSLQIHLPKPLAGQSCVNCQAIARRCENTQEDDMHETGFEISSIEPLDRRIVEHLISEFALKFAV